jgi:hypothetical protein
MYTASVVWDLPLSRLDVLPGSLTPGKNYGRKIDKAGTSVLISTEPTINPLTSGILIGCCMFQGDYTFSNKIELFQVQNDIVIR